MDNNDADLCDQEIHAHITWNKLLPYAVPDGTQQLEQILGDIREALEAVDLVKLSFCASKFNQFLDLKLHLERDQWMRAVEIFFELAVRPPISHASTMSSFASILLRIMRLPVAKHFTIGLEWKPMFDVIQEYLYQPSRQSKLFSDENCIKAVISLAEKSRQFFPGSTKEELLALINPLKFPIQLRYLSQFVSMLVVFLPTGQIDDSIVEMLRPTGGALWSSSSKRIETLNMLLLNRVTKSKLVSPINWNDWTPFLFNTLRRHLKLPGGEAGPKSIPKWNPEEKAGTRIIRNLHSDFTRYFAKWLVRAITDDNDLLRQLEVWLQSFDSFFHPSNGGSWSNELAHFVGSLVEAMNKRLFRKGLPFTLPPLAQETVDRFARILWPALSKMLFSKNFVAAFSAQETIRDLSNLSPQFVLEEVCLMVEPALGALCEPHRTSASIGVLAVVSRKLLDQRVSPSGVSIIFNFLEAALPGIDSNDPLKTLNTLTLISHVLSVLPLYDVSAGFYQPGEDSVENANIEATAAVENFVLLFLDQCFHYISYMVKPSEGHEGGNAHLVNTLDLFFMQMSPPLLKMAIEKIWKYIGEETNVYGAAAIGYLVGKAIINSPEHDLHLERILDEVLKLLGKGLALDENQTDEACSRLICFLHMLYRSFDATIALVHYDLVIVRMLSLFQLGSLCRQKTVATLISKCFKVMAKAFTGIYPKEWKSFQGEAVTIADFGKLYKLAEIQMSWHEPSDASVEICIKFFDAVVPLIGGVEFQRTQLVLLRNVLKGLLSLHANIQDKFSQYTSRVNDHVATMVTLILSLHGKLTNIENKKAYIGVIGLLLTYRGIGRRTYLELARGFNYLKGELTYYKKDPWKPRFWFVKRAHVHHLCRIEKLGYLAWGPIPQHEALIEVLFSYFANPFAELSSTSQVEIGEAAFLSAPFTVRLIEFWGKAISDPAIEDESLKTVLGARGGTFMNAICSDWSLLAQFLHWVIPLNDRPGIEAIPTIFQLITSLFVDTARSFNSPPGVYINNRILEDALGAQVDAAAYNTSRAEVRDAILAYLIEAYEGGSWRTKAMISTYILIIINNQDAIPEGVVQLFLRETASDVYDVRFVALQGAKVILHGWNLQRQIEIPVDLSLSNLLVWQGAYQPSESSQKNYTFTPCCSEESLRKIFKTYEFEESDDPGKLEFRIEICRLIQCIADLVGSSIVGILKAYISSFEQAIWPVGRQRAMAEYIGGILKSLHFTLNPEDVTRIFNVDLAPMIRMCWSKCSIDSARYWFGALFFSCRGRSPQTIQGLFGFVKEQLRAASATVSSVEMTIAILSVHAVNKALGFLLDTSDIVPVLVNVLFKSPFLIVRREAALLLKDLVHNKYKAGNDAISGIAFDTSCTEFVKALIEFCHACYADPTLTGIWLHLHTLIPIFLRANQTDEIEFQLATKMACKRLAWMDCCRDKAGLVRVLSEVFAVASDAHASAHVRRLAVEVLRLLFSRNSALFDVHMTSEYLGMLNGLIADDVLDVREAASLNLTSLLYTRHQVADQLAAKVLPQLKTRLCQIKTTSGIPTRHGLVLQGASLVLSMPYRMSSWSPQLLLTLTKYLPDRAPINTAIRKTFGEFKRTHTDNWSNERMLFTEEELDAISELLISPSYYA